MSHHRYLARYEEVTDWEDAATDSHMHILLDWTLNLISICI